MAAVSSYAILARLQSQAMLYWLGGSPVLLHSGVSPSTSNTSLQADDDVVYIKAWPSWQGRPMQAHRGMQTNSGKDKLREGDADRPDLNSLARL